MGKKPQQSILQLGIGLLSESANPIEQAIIEDQLNTLF